MIKGSENSGNNGRRLLIPLQEAAEQLSMCRQTVMRHVYEGDSDCIRFSPKAVFFTIDDLQQFIEKHRLHYDPIKI